MIVWPDKDPEAVYDYSWKPPLDEGDAIDSAVVEVVAGGLIKSNEGNDDERVTVTLDGGTDGERGEVKITVVTVDGRRFVEYFTILIGRHFIISFDDARRHLRAGRGDDTTIMDALSDAHGWVERYTGHRLVEREVEEEFEGFARLRLRSWPIARGTTLALSYDDIPLPGRLVMHTRPARLVPTSDERRWPIAPAAAVRVRFRAGYASPGDVPGNLRRAVKIMLTAYYDSRGGGKPFADAEAAAKSLCSSYRLRSL